MIEVIFDSSNSTSSPTEKVESFKYTISTSVAEDLVTICAKAPVSLPRIFSPRIEFVSKARPAGNASLSKTGALVLRDS